jgi:hypothetical protein
LRESTITRSGVRNNNEAFSRTVIDQILICSIYEEGNESNRQVQDKTFSYASHAHSPTLHPSTELPSSIKERPSMKEDPAMLEL